jgi:hypothetical protein
MQLDGSYEFLELTQVDGILVSSAREKGTGKLVQLHLFPSERAQDANQICQSIMNLPEAARRMIIKFGKDEASTYFVTEPLPPGEGLRNWIAGKIAAGRQPAPSVAPPAAPPPTPSSEGPGEFTRMYTMEDLKDAKPKPPSLSTPMPAVPPAAKTAGEFTRMYTADEIRDLTATIRPPAPEVRPTAPPVPEPMPAPAPARGNASPGLETFIFERTSVTRPAPTLSPKTPMPSPPTPQPVFTPPEPIATPVERAPLRRDTFEAPQPIFTPTPPPPPLPVQRTSPPPQVQKHVEPPPPPVTRFDWKVAVLLGAALLVVVAIVIAIVG